MRHLNVILSLALAGPAWASGLDGPLVGTPVSGPLTTDAAATWHNPAVLARLQRPSALFGGALVLAHIGYTRDRRGSYQRPDEFHIQAPVDPAALDPSLSGEADPVAATGVAPLADGFFAMPLPGGGGVGLGVHTPYAAPVAYDDPQGAQRFALQEAFILMPHVTLGVGWRVHERVQVGFGGSLIVGVANFKTVQDFAALDEFGRALAGPPASQPNSFGADAPTEVRQLDVLARPVSITDATATNLTFHGGVAVQATDDLNVALTYHHGAELVFDGDFALDMSDDFFTQDLSPVGLAYPALITGDARLALVLPKRIEAAARWDATPAWAVEGRVEYVTWSDLKALTVALKSPQLAQPTFGLPDVSRADLPRRWQDAIHLSALAHGQIAPGRLTVGLGYQSPASPDATVDAASPDGHRMSLQGALDMPLSDAWSVVAHGTLQFILPRTVTDSDYDLGNGTYQMVVAGAGAHLKVAFGGAE
ncbi:MAG: outer membrane protein transport protein [Myxococcales bacterium]|nr:outer membrane protein transport protein [Myxococcales bacterium]MCB9526270.1 outer membrane protein transport protein [Myxococcales bacterium]